MKETRHSGHAVFVHFPIALFPAHFCFHLLGSKLDEDVAAIGGFWLLSGGVAIGWVAVTFGLAEGISLLNRNLTEEWERKLLWHGCLNGTVVFGYTILFIAELKVYPEIMHGSWVLLSETMALLVLFTGNYLGGIITRKGENDETQET